MTAKKPPKKNGNGNGGGSWLGGGPAIEVAPAVGRLLAPSKSRVDPMEVGGPESAPEPAPVRRVGAVPEFTVAWVQALEPITIPGVKQVPGSRIDPMEPEWRDWRIVVAGPSVLLVAPKGWARGIIDATGGLSEIFRPVAEAHGWTEADDVRQVFEIPRSKLMIRYYLADGEAEIDDVAFAQAVRSQAIAAPDAATRAAAARIEAEAEAERRASERELNRAASRARAAVPKAAPKATKPRPVVSDDDVGYGDEGPEEEDEDE